MRPLRRALATVVLAVTLAGCGRTTQPVEPGGEVQSEARFPDVVGAETSPSDDGTFTVSATLSSPYDSPGRYADAWRVLGPDGDVLGTRELAHPHADEQPFTRSLDDVAIPTSVTEVTIEGRDSVNGWGGETITIPVEHP